MSERTGPMEYEAACLKSAAAQQELVRQETLNRPSMLLRPRLSIDGNKWCALYGENLHDGVAGFGDSPADAYAEFDREWVRPLSAAIAAAKQ